MKLLALAGALLCAAAMLPAQVQVCTTTLHAAGCGADLAVSFRRIGNHHQVELRGANLFPSSIVGMVWGFDPIPGGVPVLPGSSCLLHTVPAWAITHMADTAGNFSYQRAWPYNITLHFYMQLGALHVAPNGELTVRTTNTQLTECHVE